MIFPERNLFVKVSYPVMSPTPFPKKLEKQKMLLNKVDRYASMVTKICIQNHPNTCSQHRKYLLVDLVMILSELKLGYV